MRLGLLLCDHIAPAFQDIASGYPELFAAWLAGVEWEVYAVCDGQFPTDLDTCAAWVCTGSRASVYEDVPWIHRLSALVRRLHDEGRPYLGVCFGHQMLAAALGGRVSASPRGWCVGVHRFEVDPVMPWMQPPLPHLDLLMMCQDQVMALPPGSQVLARGEACPIGMFATGRMLGIQAHPEFLPAYEAALLHSRRDRIGPAKVDAALATLERPLDVAPLARWVHHFWHAPPLSVS